MTAHCSPAAKGRALQGLQTSWPGSALTSPAVRRPPRLPGPPGRRSLAGLPPRLWEGPAAAAPRRFGPSGQRNLNSSSWTCAGDSRLPRPHSGSREVGNLPSFPDASLTLFSKSSEGPTRPSPQHAGGTPGNGLRARPSSRIRSLTFQALPQPWRLCTPKWVQESHTTYFQGRRRGGLSQGERAGGLRRPVRARVFAMRLGMQRERFLSAPPGKDPRTREHGPQKPSSPSFPESQTARPG